MSDFVEKEGYELLCPYCDYEFDGDQYELIEDDECHGVTTCPRCGNEFKYEYLRIDHWTSIPYELDAYKEAKLLMLKEKKNGL